MKRRILVVAAHPDDEVLGCGGTMAKHARAGDDVHVLTLAEGVSSRADNYDPSLWIQANKARMNDATAAHRVLGVKSFTAYEYPDNRLDRVDLLDLVKKIEALKRKLKPDTVYTHHAGDVNIDHRRVHDAVIAAFRPVPGETLRRLFFFEVPSSTEWRPSRSAAPFAPDWFEDISDTLDRKIKALRAYGPEMRPWPLPRSYKAVEHLARWRGATVGREAAEAFIVGRVIAD